MRGSLAPTFSGTLSPTLFSGGGSPPPPPPPPPPSAAPQTADKLYRLAGNSPFSGGHVVWAGTIVKPVSQSEFFYGEETPTEAKLQRLPGQAMSAGGASAWATKQTKPVIGSEFFSN